jgi:S-(hydroxymethyl)glutathione dehydrogenase / alcohol dehydrogenase
MPKARAAVLRQTGTPMTIEMVEVGPVAAGDVLVRIRAASLCHTDLEAIEGSLAVQLPAVLGHEAAGEIAELGDGVTDLGIGDRVVLSWNPHCGRCFYCERAQPILCREFLANGPKAFHFDGKPRLACDGAPMHQLMYLGGFSEYCVVPAQSAIRVPDTMPFDRAALLGCGVMTGVGAATRIADLRWGAVAMVIGCGAVGLSAVQGCRLAGASSIIAVDPNPARRQLAQAIGATHACEPSDAPALARTLTESRGADVVVEAAVRWGALMQEKRITRSSYGGAKPAQDFPLLARAYLDGTLKLDEMISARIPLEAINEGFAALKRGETVRSVIMFQ